MANTTFNCPHCQQAIQCDDQWAGQQIQCPLCQGALVVPQAAGSAPAPTQPAEPSSLGKQLVQVPGSTRLSFQQNAQKPAAPGRNIPMRNLTQAPTKRPSPIGKIVTWTVVLIAVGVGIYFGWGLVGKWQDKANTKSREEARNSDGGQVGHIANLYDALDKTEVEGRGLKNPAGGAVASGPRQRDSSVPAAIPVAPDAGAAAPGTAALVAPVYTLDVAQATVPEGTVNGVIAGSNFVAQVARVDAVGASQVLRLTQGSPTAPDREILVYLRLKPGDKLSGHTWTIAPEDKNADVAEVIKRWTVRAGFAPALKAYTSGYALRLELGQLANGMLPGKIFVALPDNEHSVAGGVFNATTTLADAIGAAAALPGAAPQAGPATPSRYQQRSGAPRGRY